MKSINRAIILAGGKGKRLRPYSFTLPKPLIPIGKLSTLEILINQLISNGIKHITICLNYKGDLIETFINKKKIKGATIDFSHEKKALGTFGPLSIIKDLPENFLLLNGDVFTNLNFRKLSKLHIKQKSIFTMSSFNYSKKIQYGVLKSKKNKYLLTYKEKPIENLEVNMGVYAINTNILKFIKKNVKIDFDKFINLLSKKKKILIYSGKHFWFDIGSPESLSIVTDFLKKKKYKV